MGLGVTVRKRSVYAVVAAMTLLVAACTPSIGPAPTPTAEPSPTEAPTVITVTPELPSLTTTPEVSTPEAATATPESQAQQSTTIECTVTARSLRLRAGPATTFDIVRGLSNGQPLAASARNPEGTWAAVRTADGVEGWVSIDFITCAQAVDTLPQATPAP